MAWSQISPSGLVPEAREGHTAAILGKYMLITGGSGSSSGGGGALAVGASAATGVTAAAGSGAAASGAGNGAAGAAAAGSVLLGPPKRLTDTFVLDLFTGPKWELLDDGAWGSSLLWLKPVCAFVSWVGEGPWVGLVREMMGSRQA